MKSKPAIRERTIETVLGPLGGRVMRIALQQGEVSVRDVTTALSSGPERVPAYTTVMTIMARLHERGLLLRLKRGKGYVYRPIADERSTIDELSNRAVNQLLETYGSSAMRQFAVHLAALDASEREQLLRLSEAGADKP